MPTSVTFPIVEGLVWPHQPPMGESGPLSDPATWFLRPFANLGGGGELPRGVCSKKDPFGRHTTPPADVGNAVSACGVQCGWGISWLVSKHCCLADLRLAGNAG